MTPTLASIKNDYATCSDEDVVTLKTAIIEFLGIAHTPQTIGLSMWPYTQIIQVCTLDRKPVTWVGLCATTSRLSKSNIGCECGKCGWTQGLGGTGGPGLPDDFRFLEYLGHTLLLFQIKQARVF
jgi:hypothetical protein